MFRNLKAEMVRSNFTGFELSKELGMTNSTFSQKLNGKFDFSLNEAIRIKKILGTELTIEELFKAEE
jgi:transcriptional regulator with XRE-family HTH domain